MRLDLYLVRSGAVETRQKAARLIKEGSVTVDGVPETKPSAEADGKTVEVRGNRQRYVGRGGLKLERALEVFGVSPEGAVCLDLGASTGGFTDCLLQHGAKKVYALDVGHGQLSPKLRDDRRVVSMEGVNARFLSKEMFADEIDFVASDLSFISQKLIYSPLRALLRDGVPFVSLIKPQFEAGKSGVGKKGIVKDPGVRERAASGLAEEAEISGFGMHGFCVSPITGGDGNIEYLALFVSGGERTVDNEEIKKTVYGPV